MPVYFADPHSPWQRPSNENTNRLYREYLPKGTAIPDHQPYLTTIAEEINNRPRRRLGFLTPAESFTRLLAGEPHFASTLCHHLSCSWSTSESSACTSIVHAFDV